MSMVPELQIACRSALHQLDKPGGFGAEGLGMTTQRSKAEGQRNQWVKEFKLLCSLQEAGSDHENKLTLFADLKLLKC